MIKSASCGAKLSSIISWFQVLVSRFIKQSIVAPSMESRIGEDIFLGVFLGSHLCCQILTDLPSPTRRQTPSRITSRPWRILLQAYEPTVVSFAFKIEQCGKNFSLKTLLKRDLVLVRSHQASLASRASWKMIKSLKPIPPINLDFVNFSHRIQYIFPSIPMLSPPKIFHHGFNFITQPHR